MPHKKYRLTINEGIEDLMLARKIDK